jgi:hypothetical protein
MVRKHHFGTCEDYTLSATNISTLLNVAVTCDEGRNCTQKGLFKLTAANHPGTKKTGKAIRIFIYIERERQKRDESSQSWWIYSRLHVRQD